MKMEILPNLNKKFGISTWMTLLLKKGVGLGIHLEASFGNVDKSITLGFEAFNNETEYEALLHDLEAVQLLGTRKIKVNFDSKLVVCQTLAQYEAKDERMKPY